MFGFELIVIGVVSQIMGKRIRLNEEDMRRVRNNDENNEMHGDYGDSDDGLNFRFYFCNLLSQT